MINLHAKQFQLVPVLITEQEDWNSSERVFALIRNDWLTDKWGNPEYGRQYSYSFAAYRPVGPLPTMPRGGFESFTTAAEAARHEFAQWRAGNVAPGTQMPRHVVWRTQYRRRRYLKHLSEDELVQRLREVMTNHVVLTDDLKIAPTPLHKQGEYWGIMFTHILEECVMRKYRYPAPFAYRIKDTQIPKYDWPGLEEAVSKVQALHLEEGKFLIKFSKAKYLHAMLKTGSVRVMPASSYDDSSLNPAIKDSELEINFMRLPSEVKLEAFDGRSGEPKGIILPLGNIAYTFKAPSDFFAYCLTSALSIRLFGDFEADACLIVKRPGDFLVRVAEAFSRNHPNWECAASSVDYYDPLNAEPEKLAVHFSKHFRFAYQQEFRMVWTPPSVERALEPIFLTVGSLEDICELIELPIAKAA